MTDMPYTPKVTGTGVKASIQRFGGYLAGMVMPNIGAFIAWGLITAMFISDGWVPNETSGTPAAAWCTGSAAAWSAPWPR